MRTVETTFQRFGGGVLLIGLKGDSNATEIQIDCAEAMTEYQCTEAAMIITGPDGKTYAGDISLDENSVMHWVVSARDCQIAGHGSARIDLADSEDTVVVSAEAKTIIMKTNMQGIAPDQIEDWMQAASIALEEVRFALLDLNDKAREMNIQRVASLTPIPVASGQIVDSVGIPVYVDDISEYSGYGITDTGWYAFVRITAKQGVTVKAQTTVTGADGYIATIGANHVDVAVRFGVAAQSKSVTIAWNSISTETFVFRATDLAVRNLDYRSTFYIYDIADFAEWTWALTADETFQSGVDYYTESGGEYTLATVTVGDAVPAETYYVHTKLTFSGMIRNVTYRFNEMVDCPIEIVLPEVPDDGYGAWFEIQMQYSKQVSTTLLPTDNTVVIGTAQTQGQTAWINVIDLQYSDVNDVKMWTLLNTHSNLPSSGGT